MKRKIFVLGISIVLFLTALIGCNSSAPKQTEKMEPGKAIIVTRDNFIRAETDMYFSGMVRDGMFGTMHHDREIAGVDNQPVIRYNREVLLSTGLFDLSAGPVTITVPDPGKRFLSILVINEDHYNPLAEFGGGTYTLSAENTGTRYAAAVLRLFVNPDDPKDMAAAHALQDSVKVSQPGGPGTFEIPNWDEASRKKVHESLLIEGKNIVDSKGSFGTKETVDPEKHLVATATGWGGNPESVAVYLNFSPEKNDGKTIYRLHVPANVPVDGFWSVAVYNAEGYFEKNPQNVYNINNVTAKKNADGSVDIQFGGYDGKTPNCIPIVDGWNYIVRLYRPRAEIINGTWKFPESQPVK